jgi:hypothetical protein
MVMPSRSMAYPSVGSFASASPAARRISSSPLSRVCATVSRASFVPMATIAMHAARRTDRLGASMAFSSTFTAFASRMAPEPKTASWTSSNESDVENWRNRVAALGSRCRQMLPWLVRASLSGMPSVCMMAASVPNIFPRQGAFGVHPSASAPLQTADGALAGVKIPSRIAQVCWHRRSRQSSASPDICPTNPAD